MESLSRKESEDLGALITSLAYLEKESRRLGFDEISTKLTELLLEIKHWVQNSSYEICLAVEKITESELFETLMKIEKVAALKDIDFDAITKAVETYDAIKRSRKEASH